MLVDEFEAERPRLRAVAYRMLGSLAEADDALQDAWLRADRAGAEGVRNVPGWLTTIVGRVCLNLLRARQSRPQTRLPDPVVSPAAGPDPEQRALLADAVGLALQVVLGSLNPDERLAFVLHDMFAVPFDDVAVLLERTPAATRQLAGRARRRVRDTAPAPMPDLARQRAAVDAFFAAARDGDFGALLEVLHPDVVLRADGGPDRPHFTVVLRGARDVAGEARRFGRLAGLVGPVLINGTAGILVRSGEQVLAVMAFTVHDDRIVAIHVLNDPARLRALIE
ncbi:RNA polymerase sigma factor SigJ [Paractinoplanes ferrugineus]|uniref:RNA polymerase sigma factor n=1 Tax=Paractinoplanes ferrugineus TaxID=113564 RepID=A0A919J0V9_9ACTN|nr:sigma factor [Actinoplanes ferrugineus]GIE11332.1 RNA polymerase sigma factor [Actinoplanes ferrugineus]